MGCGASTSTEIGVSPTKAVSESVVSVSVSSYAHIVVASSSIKDEVAPAPEVAFNTTNYVNEMYNILETFPMDLLYIIASFIGVLQGRVIRTMRYQSPVSALCVVSSPAFSEMVLSGHADGFVRCWNPSSGRVRFEFRQMNIWKQKPKNVNRNSLNAWPNLC